MKKKFWKQTTFAIFAFFAMSIIASFCVTSFASGIAYAGSRNGGLMYVGQYSTYGVTDGTTLSGATATNGGGVYVNTGGTLNISGGAIYGNTATTNGNNIYNAGTTNITGGTIANNIEKMTRYDADGNVDPNGSYIYFGSYPQTIKASNVSIDETKYKTLSTGEKYYLGSDNQYYAKLSANPYGSSYVFSDGTTIVSGTEYYFRVEPIKWRILSEDKGTAIILAEIILDAHQFYSKPQSRTINGNTIYANNYKYSDIRSWLNGYSSTYGEDWSNNGFLQRAFTESEQEYTQTTLVDNSASTTDNTTNSYACENTEDKVWLLSYQDMKNTAYGFNSSTMRQKQPSDYARANYALYVVSCGNSDYWWSRSPNSSQKIDAYGSSYDGSVKTYYVADAFKGVVPAMTISLEIDSVSDDITDYGIYNTGELNIYGGSVYDHIYSSGTLNTKVGANIQGIITLADTATIKVEDYAGVTPNYKINLSSTRGDGTVITFKGSDIEPDLFNIEISGHNTAYQGFRAEKDSSGNWTIKFYNATYKVTFDANGGSCSTSTKAVFTNTEVGDLPTPTRTGYTFNGWYTAQTGGTKISTTTIVSGDATYYAQWTVNNYSVAFLNMSYNLSFAGTMSGASWTTTDKTGSGESIYKSISTTTRGGPYISGLNNYMVNGSKYRIYFDAKASTAASTTGTFEAGGTAKTLSLTTAYQEFYIDVTYNSSSTYKALTFYGTTWTGQNFYIKNIRVAKIVAYDSTYGELPTPNKTGYTFGGWSTSVFQIDEWLKNFANVRSLSTVAGSSSVDFANKTITLTATGSDCYTGTYTNGVNDYKVAVLPNTTYTFSWKQSATTNSVRNFIFLYKAFADTSYVYAKDAESYDSATGRYYMTFTTTSDTNYLAVRFGIANMSGSSLTISDVKLEKGSKITESNIVSTTKVITAENHNLYAQWTANKYTVVYNANGGTGTTASSTHYYDITKALTTNGFSRVAYAFTGWNTASDGSGTSYTNQQSILNLFSTDGSSITLYAQWKAIYTRVTESNGYSYIYFGSYPQTLKADDVSITSTTADSDGYYPGSDGCRYAKVVAKPYNSSYTFYNGTTIVNGTTYYFKVEPIKWRILSEKNGNAMILAELNLDMCAFDDLTSASNNYAQSEVRAFLNGYSTAYGSSYLNKGFFQIAFTAEEKAYIQTTLVDNSAETTDSQAGQYACENTEDKIFLLSYKDVLTKAYGFDTSTSAGDVNRRKYTTDYFRARGGYYFTDSSYTNIGTWWLRSPHYEYPTRVWTAFPYGHLGYSYIGEVAGRGVVPALIISLDGTVSSTAVSWNFASSAESSSSENLNKSDRLFNGAQEGFMSNGLKHIIILTLSNKVKINSPMTLTNIDLFFDDKQFLNYYVFSDKKKYKQEFFVRWRVAGHYMAGYNQY